MTGPLTEDMVNGLGPIDSLVIEFPDGKLGADGFNGLLRLVDAGSIAVLDLEFVAKRPGGAIEVIPAHDLGSVEGLDMEIFDGASSGLYTNEDLNEVGAHMAEGSIAALIIYEERSLIPVVAAWERAGGRVIGDGPVPVEELVIALDETEPGK